jgi:addiction module HigA family antidote
MASKSRNTTTKAAKIAPVHPGEILKETLEDLDMSMNQLAQALRVPANRISGIVSGERAVTGETALRLARYFGTTPGYWIGMQAQFDLETARDRFGSEIQAQVSPMRAA